MNRISPTEEKKVAVFSNDIFPSFLRATHALPIKNNVRHYTW